MLWTYFFFYVKLDFVETYVVERDKKYLAKLRTEVIPSLPSFCNDSSCGGSIKKTCAKRAQVLPFQAKPERTAHDVDLAAWEHADYSPSTFVSVPCFPGAVKRGKRPLLPDL